MKIRELVSEQTATGSSAGQLFHTVAISVLLCQSFAFFLFVFFFV